MLRTKVDPQATLWESLLPEEFRRLPPGLCAVDALLDDPVFFEPFVPYFDPCLRPALDPDRDVPSADAPAFSLRPRLRDAVWRGHRLAQLAALLPDRSLRQGAGRLHAHEDHQAMRLRAW